MSEQSLQFCLRLNIICGIIKKLVPLPTTVLYETEFSLRISTKTVYYNILNENEYILENTAVI